MKTNTIIFLLLLVLLVAAGCQPPAPSSSGAAVPKTVAAPEESRQSQWDQVLVQGKREGVVNLYISAIWGSGLRSSLTKAFSDKYGIGLEFSPLSGTEFVAKVKAEQNAGLYLADIFGAGSSTFVTTMIPNNLLGPIEPMLLLPEVKDPKVWDGGDMFYFNKDDHRWIELLRVMARTIMYNTGQVKPEEIDSYRDLLKPQFKGKITMLDPADGGAGTTMVNHLVTVYGWDEGLAFFKELMVKQDPAIFRDARLQVETVARGKYSIVLGGSGQYKAEFLALGAPLAIKVPKEGDYGTTSFGAVSVPTKLPHPNAATVFLNWLLTRDGQSLFAKGAGGPSRRLDASTEGVDPVFIPLPGEKMNWQTPEFSLRGGKVTDAVKGIMKELGQ